MYPDAKRAELLDKALNAPAPDEAGTVTLTMLGQLWDYVVVQRTPGVPLDKAMRGFADKAYVLDRSSWAYRGVWAYDYTRLVQLTQPALLLQPAEALLEASLTAAKLISNITVRELPDLNRDIFDLAPERLAHELRHFFT